MKPSPHILLNLLRDIHTISWIDLKKVTIPNIYQYQQGLAKVLEQLEYDNVIKIEREYFTWNQSRFKSIEYIGNVLPRFKKITIEDDKPKRVIRVKVKIEKSKGELMPCKARLIKCFHTGCYLADICSIRPEYIEKQLARFGNEVKI